MIPVQKPRSKECSHDCLIRVPLGMAQGCLIYCMALRDERILEAEQRKKSAGDHGP